jgi:hypothetical protein
LLLKSFENLAGAGNRVTIPCQKKDRFGSFVDRLGYSGMINKKFSEEIFRSENFERDNRVIIFLWRKPKGNGGKIFRIAGPGNSYSRTRARFRDFARFS